MSEIGLFSIVRCQPASSLSFSLSLLPSLSASPVAISFVRGQARPVRLMPIIIIIIINVVLFGPSSVCTDAGVCLGVVPHQMRLARKKPEA